jgi:hypothetical protein
MNGHSIENPFAAAFRTSSAVLVLILAASLCYFVPPLMVLVPLAGAVSLWALFRHPIGVLGLLLAFMPLDYMAIQLGKFFGLPHMTLVSACTKEIPLLLLIFVLWRRNGFKPAAPDWFLLTCCALATLRTAFEGSWAALAIDLNFIVPYFVGRMTVLSQKQEQSWAKRAVGIVAILSMLGMIEVFVLGEGPRTLLYVSTDAMTTDGALTSSFHATGFEGLREAATMVGPNGFGALCMIALVIWWVYCRNLLPAVMIAAGLVCSLTRSAWLGVAAAILLLALIMDQKKRLFLYATLSLALFVVSIPVLGLSDFLFFNQTGQDPSAQGHRDEILNGMQYVADHPLGSGNENLSRLALRKDANITVFETTYPSFAAEYGIPAVLCFVCGLFSAGYMVWRNRSPLGYVAIGVLVGMAVVMTFTLPLDDRRLGAWALFPVGLAVQASITRSRTTSE